MGNRAMVPRVKKFKVCPNCGGPMSLSCTGVCKKCYFMMRFGKEWVGQKVGRVGKKYYGTCPSCGGQKSYGNKGVCRECFNERRRMQRALKDGEQVIGRLTTDHTHYWIVDSHNVGTCKVCKQVKHFGQLMEQGKLERKSTTPVKFSIKGKEG